MSQESCPPSLSPSSEMVTEIIEGLPIHYVAYNQRHLAAWIIGHENASQENGYPVDIMMATNMTNAAGQKSFGIQFHQDVKYSRDPQPGTWHWPEFVW